MTRVRTTQLSDGEISDILAEHKKGTPVPQICSMYNRSDDTVMALIKEFRPTKALAQAKLQASLSGLVDKVIEKADVDQILDILSRTNVGVLDPVSKGAAGNNNLGIMVSVNTGSLAAVTDPASLPLGYEVVDAVTDTSDVAGRNIRIGPVQVAQHSVEV